MSWRVTPRLSFIDLSDVLVFGRFGRTDADGAFATCHCLTLPDERTRLLLLARPRHGRAHPPLRMVRDQVAAVRVGARDIKYLISFVLPRFCDQSLEHSRKHRALSRGHARGSRSSTRSSTSCITSIRTNPASAACRGRWLRLAALPRALVLRGSGGDGEGYMDSGRTPRCTISFRKTSRASPHGTAAWSRPRSGISRRFRSGTWSR